MLILGLKLRVSEIIISDIWSPQNNYLQFEKSCSKFFSIIEEVIINSGKNVKAE